MGKVIIPKHTADLDYFNSTMKILSDSKDWILMNDFTDKLFNHLVDIGKEQTRSTDNTHYTKCAQLPMYFGFAKRKVNLGAHYLKITPAGINFYDAICKKDSASMNTTILESLEHGCFGEGNDAVPSSRTDVDAPNLFVRASYDLSGLSNKEFAYLLWSLVDKNDDYTGAIKKIQIFRSKGTFELNNAAKIYQDCKPIMILERWGFLEKGRIGLVVSQDVDSLYHNRLLNLKIYSIDRNVDLEQTSITPVVRESDSDMSSQEVLYGAPGTGKSWKIVNASEGMNVIRVTFHPDSDYSTFVGAYKPTMEPDKYATKIEGYSENANGEFTREGEQFVRKEHIIYRFHNQAFLTAYVNAWRLCTKYLLSPVRKFTELLVIEEINRGNCAQIFGDIFQLLDREDDGYSSYPINADQDLSKFLHCVFSAHKDNEGNEIPELDLTGVELNGRGVTTDEIKKGTKLLLPPNLYIWATMNTSDQSLFPIDSAFKRRWEWKYFPIENAKKNWKIDVNEKKYDWWEFLKQINDRIKQDTLSSDKQLGYFFCKAKGNIISADHFVNKIVYYLWSDVYKDVEDSDLFPKGIEPFFVSGGKSNAEEIIKFLEILGVKPDGPTKTNEPASDTQSSNGEASQENHSAIDTSQS